MKIDGKLVCASALKLEEIEDIKRKFEHLLNCEIDFKIDMDESLLGGFVVTANNTIYDLSIKSYLKRMNNYMTEGHDESTINIDDVLSAIKGNMNDSNLYGEQELQNRIADFKNDYDIAKIGIVSSVGDGVVTVRGLENCKYGELLQFEKDAYGIVMNLETDTVGTVLLNGTTAVTEGSMVRHTGSVVRVPVGEEMLGRVINPLGHPLDSNGPVKTENFRNIETEAPPIIQRQSVNQPLQTGIMAIDAMIPIGRGQRELIIGDRQTGKTAIAIDTIINQRNTGVICVYVAIAQKASTISEIVSRLEEFGAMTYTTVVASTASDAAPMQYIAPYAGCAIAEEFMYKGKDVLVVYDDLSKHAVAYRTMSLLLRRPPGREAYPGDVFYLHSRLLERAAKLSDKLGGGSMTALPIIETQDGDISSYIPTNVISITDGQIYLEAELFNSGQRPAINVGLSVSRVGGSAQISAMRKVAGPLRIELAQYRELAVFAQFASDLDKTTRDTLANGLRLTNALKQPQYKPYSVTDQVLILCMAAHKVLMEVPENRVAEFVSGYLNYINVACALIVEAVNENGSLTKEQEDSIVENAIEFRKSFLVDSRVAKDE